MGEFAGRVSEMIKKGGINISPAEVEDVLMRHPAVAQVGVVGIPDRQQGELLAAFIVPKPGCVPTVEELREGPVQDEVRLIGAVAAHQVHGQVVGGPERRPEIGRW